MRTTITLDEDVAAQLRRVMRERDLTFKDAVNATLRAGLGAPREQRGYRLPTYRMGVRPGIDLDRALRLDAALEDDETLRQLRTRK
jgi:Arc/MetJ family transcription regulator